ncbi:MAG: PhoPQ-activated protein PqaA family protein [Candidatus Competibacteraceae bacterium]
MDPRVKAIVPASIDMLNLGRQFIHHCGAYGFFAPALKDYVEFDLPCRVQTPEGQALLQVVDPYAYRDRYTMPEDLNATGDQFLRLRFLTVLLLRSHRPQVAALHAEHRPQAEGRHHRQGALVDGRHSGRQDQPPDQLGDGRGGVLRVSPTAQPKEVKLWQATNPNARDFRLEEIGAVWTSQTLAPQADGTYLGVVQRPATGWTAFMIEVTFDTAGTLEPDQIYSTGVQIIPDTLPYAGQACNGQYNRNLESPTQGSAESGVGLIRGWVCQANTVQVRIDGGDLQQVAYGTTREDTLAACGDTNNGFGYTFNWNRLGNGAHNLRAYADSVEFANRSISM